MYVAGTFQSVCKKRKEGVLPSLSFGLVSQHSALRFRPNSDENPYPGSEIVDLPQQCSVRQGLQFLLAWVRFFWQGDSWKFVAHGKVMVLQKAFLASKHCFFGNLCYISGGTLGKNWIKRPSGTYSWNISIHPSNDVGILSFLAEGLRHLQRDMLEKTVNSCC